MTVAPVPEYTRAGSAEFCDRMASLAGSVEGTDPASVAGRRRAAPEPATDWSRFIETQKPISSDPTGAAIESLDQADLTAYGQASSNVSAYLADICGL